MSWPDEAQGKIDCGGGRHDTGICQPLLNFVGRFPDDSGSGLVHILFVHVLQSRPWNALHYRPVASDKLKVGGFRFLINVHHGKYPVVALSGNAVMLPWNAECHGDSLRRSFWGSRGQKFKLHYYPLVGS